MNLFNSLLPSSKLPPTPAPPSPLFEDLFKFLLPNAQPLPPPPPARLSPFEVLALVPWTTVFTAFAAVTVSWLLWLLVKPLPQPRASSAAEPPKIGFSASKLPARIDAVVIGSGPSGLGAAAMLARRGKAVVVLEANEALGGGLHTWEHHSVPFETGFHYLGEVHCARSPLRRLVDYVTGGLEWAAQADCAHAPGVYDELSIGGGDEARRLQLRPGEAAWEGEMRRAFPERGAAIHAFKERCKASAATFLPGVIWRSLRSKTLRALLRRPLLAACRPWQHRSVAEVLEDVTDDPQLIGTLSYLMVGCCGVGPRAGAFGALAGVVCHFMQGGAYPRGGAAAVVAGMVNVIEHEGGRAFVRAPVGAILLDAKGHAVGVRMRRNSVEVLSPLVISTIGAHLTLTSLLPHPLPPPGSTQLAEAAAGAAVGGTSPIGRSCIEAGAAPPDELCWRLEALRSLQERLAAAPLSSSRGHLNLFVTLKGSAEELALPRHNTWVFPSYEHDDYYEALSQLPVAAAAEHEAPWVYAGMAFPSAKDPGWGELRPALRGVSTAVVIAEVPTGWWNGWEGTKVHHRGAEYEGLKQALAAKLLALLTRRFPQCEGKVLRWDLGTPLSTQHYLNKRHGESYGLQPTPALFAQQEAWLHPAATHAALPGLLLAGQDVNFDGFAGALLSGIMCAAAADGLTVWLDVVRAIGVRNLLQEMVLGGEDLSATYAQHAPGGKGSGAKEAPVDDDYPACLIGREFTAGD